ncbi:thioredoxin reductase [Fonticella tunisiensis]|uniref:Thioredoxin reductase n=1 Tax=Fonticella tunisiensis TaxID=1096341 RepID=A0A4R7KTQ5_9CLOT|nr:thioredoxin reductase [Fonticella tunisiensis]
MKLKYDVTVIGGGPAGLAAAIEAKKGDCSVLILERNEELGGILNQCIHPGFGLQYFKEELTGPEYAERFINKVNEMNIDVLLNTMVINISKDRAITAVNDKGLLKIESGAVILAMGCRERTRGAIMIPGARPAGVFMAGQAQRYINMENQKIGNKAVILGSGDIGLIMARRLTLEGIEVVGVFELMPYPNGLLRNIKQCLEDFNIPLYLSTTVTRIIGKDRIEGVVVSRVDEKLNPIEGTEERIDCDTLLLSVGLIPENELSLKAGVELNTRTNGPLVDNDLQTNIPGIFACGNVLHVHDLVDHVSREGELAGQKAVEFIKNKKERGNEIILKCGKNLVYTVPKYITNTIDNLVNVYFRVSRPMNNGCLTIKSSKGLIFKGKPENFRPNKMVKFNLPPKIISKVSEELYIDVEEGI